MAEFVFSACRERKAGKRGGKSEQLLLQGKRPSGASLDSLSKDWLQPCRPTHAAALADAPCCVGQRSVLQSPSHAVASPDAAACVFRCRREYAHTWQKNFTIFLGSAQSVYSLSDIWKYAQESLIAL